MLSTATSINSPSSTSSTIIVTTTSSKTQDHNQTTSLISTSATSETAEDRGFTIVVPANVRFRGVNMQLDLKLDQKTLAAASDISRAVEEAVTSASLHHQVEPSRQQTIRIPSSDSAALNFSITEPLTGEKNLSTPLLMDSTVGEGSASAEESKSFQSVSSTTNEGLDSRNGLDIKSPTNKNINLPTSSQLFSLNQLNTIDDTTVSTSMRIATEEATSTSSKQEEQPLRPPSECLPSSTGVIAEDLMFRPQSQSSTYEQRDDAQSMANTSHEDVSFHDSQPCSSSTQNAALDICTGKKKRDRTTQANYCGFFDKDKGQCKQRAILSFKYCIRHILLDSEAPYKQCQFKRKPKSKKDEHLLCTNAIRANKPEIYCSTHLIMKGMLQPKKKGGAAAAASAKEAEEQHKHTDMPEDSALDFQPTENYNSQSSFMDTSPYDLRPPMSFGGNSYAGDNWDQLSNMSGGPNTPSLNPPSRSSGYQQQPQQQQTNGQYVHHVHQQPSFEQHPDQQRSIQMQPAQSRQDFGGYGEQRAWSNVAPPSADQQQYRPPPPFENDRYPQSPFMPNNCSQQHLHSSFNTSFSPVEHNQQDFLHPMHSPAHPQQQQQQQQQQKSSLVPPSSNQMIPASNNRYPSAPQTGSFQGNVPPSKNASSSYNQSGPVQPKQQIQQQQQQQQSSQSISRLSKQHPQLAAKLLQPPISQGDGNRPQSGQTEQLYRPHPPNSFQNFSNPQLGSVGKQMENRPVENSVVRTNYMPNNQQQQIGSHVNGAVHIAEFAGNTQQQSILVPIQNLQPSSQFHFIDIIPVSSSPLAFLSSEPPPVKYNIEALEDSDSLDEELKIRRDYLTDDGTHQKAQKNIKLRQKRQKVKIQGAFRNIPLVDSMCKIVENHDFDSTDLFPLGLEPSDDESSSDDGFPAFGNETYSQFLSPPSNRIELYLLKKQLRLESSRLVQRAKLSVPIIQASKQYKTCVGASLRARQMNRRREAITGVEISRIRRCTHVNQEPCPDPMTTAATHRGAACNNPCLPMSNHCAEHVLYNVNQKLFSYCSRRCCSRPVLCTDSSLLEGLCRKHFEESENVDKIITQQSSMFPSSKQPPKMVKKPSLTTLSNIQPPRRHEMVGQQRHTIHTTYHHGLMLKDPSGGIFGDQALGSADHLNDVDVVEGDVSLASVAKDLGFDGRELTDMLEGLPMDESLDNNDIDDDTFLGDARGEDDVSGMALGHSWADVEQFLLSEGYHGDSPQPMSVGLSAAQLPNSGAASYEPLIYHEMR